jgi:hypothetical protein
MTHSSFKFRRSNFRATRRGGFSFAEVMFAVIVLGIGFIMIAAIFPVAIGQTQASLSDSAGVTVGQTGVIAVTQLLQEGGTPVSLPTVPVAIPAPYGDVSSYMNVTTPPYALGDGIVHPIEGTGTLTPSSRWDRLKGSFIDTADPRFAWIPVGYKIPDESGGSVGDPKTVGRTAQIYILAIQSQSKPIFDMSDFTASSSASGIFNGISSAHPKVFTGVDIKDNDPAYGIDTVKFTGADPFKDAIATGAYILISNDHLDTNADADIKKNGKIANGLYYRLGANLAPNVWELQPGNDFTPIRVAPGPDNITGTADDIFVNEIPTADVLMVGKGYNDNTNPSGFEGGAMDLLMLPPITVQLPLQIP